MVAKRKKKYESGEGSAYMSRRAALKKLQLTLKDFRKLCILKGVYPREPRKRKVAQKGATGIQTLYSKKDILFLAADPILWKMREFKSHFKKVGRARAMNNQDQLRRFLKRHPTLPLDHIVKERYPSFNDALRDLDDCLTLLFLFSTFPSLKAVPRDHSELCQRLTMEFLHVVIAAKALRKVFVSIKGYYFQAELRGETITWIVPHHFSFQPQNKSEVDFKVMSHFVEFYCVMLGFVNFRLYNQLNLYYPPKLTQSTGDDIEKTLVDENAYVSERIASLNVELARSGGNDPIEEEEQQLDQFALSDNPEQMEKMRKDIERSRKVKTLFKGLKIFVNREVPREPIVFCVRALGGEVSWDKTLFVGSTFDEDDESITHQIVDRPSMEKQYISRYYVQPQWIFDSVNAAEVLPIERYLMGAILPPHLSPFLDETRDQRYKPPEELELLGLEVPAQLKKAQETSDGSDEESDAENAEEDKEEEDEEEHSGEESSGDGEGDEEDENIDKEEKERLEKKKKMAVTRGKLEKEDPSLERREAYSEYKLREKMIKNKHRKLYKSMMEGRTKRKKEAWLLRKKRRRVEEEEGAAKKAARKEKKKAAAAMEA
ncbi:hypothetical protein FOCC_FOCC004656 [Frankliniella occidentalis]|uniref:Pescadillo homolog n=1 Tax=Frankliniella occidentalis TaxID=133901 RepID=A0A6J1SIM6_FRAOC|nr:pescadillo homolog [Frankliniella occidentalis]KAE8748645.1 hypothetical protein FOCC_FOCC004656 [Frankliniella occidentalis]